MSHFHQSKPFCFESTSEEGQPTFYQLESKVLFAINDHSFNSKRSTSSSMFWEQKTKKLTFFSRESLVGS